MELIYNGWTGWTRGTGFCGLILYGAGHTILFLMRNVYTCLVGDNLRCKMNPNNKSVRVTQYEVLEWAWNLGKKYKCPVGFQDHVKKFLVMISDDGVIDFEVTLKEMMRGDW